MPFDIAAIRNIRHSPHILAVVTGLIVVDAAMADAATRYWVIALGIFSLALALLAASVAELRPHWLWVLVFLLILPVLLAGFGCIQAIQSSGLPVGVYLYTAVMLVYKKNR
ncbi:MAG: hypothetical protein ABFD54_04585 [Armatimonadota bacterium]|nr:hypothetical protein [bacterium]